MVDLPSRTQDTPVAHADALPQTQSPAYPAWNLEPQDYRNATRAQQDQQHTDLPNVQISSFSQTQDAVVYPLRNALDRIADSNPLEKGIAFLASLGGAYLAVQAARKAMRDTALQADTVEPQINDAQRQSLRRQSEVDYERLTFQHRPAPRLEEIARELTAPTHDREKLEYPKPGRTGPYTDWSDFTARGLESRDTPVIRYGVQGYPHLSITIDEEYAKKLDEVRRLRLATEMIPLNAEEEKRQSEAREQLSKNLLRQAILPEDVVAHLHELPNADLVHEIVLSGQPNPQDVWHDQTYEKGFTSAATANDEGTITLYPAQQAWNIGRTLRHEWAHLLEKHCAGRAEFNDAATIESDGFYMGKYAKRNDRENWAVHFEELTDDDADRFLHFCNEAPVRAYAMCEGLRETLADATLRSPNHDQLLARVDYFEEHVKPKAVDALIEVLNKYDVKNYDSIYNTQAATCLLGEMKDMRAVNSLAEFAKAHPNLDGLLAWTSAVETLKMHAPEQLPKFLDQFLSAEYPWNRHVVDELKTASSESQEARDILAKYRQRTVSDEPLYVAHTEVIGKPGPGVTEEMVDRLRSLVDQTGAPIVVFGSRQTGWSPENRRPFMPDSDYDIGVIGTENFDKFMTHPAFKNGSYRSNDIPGLHHPPVRIFDTEHQALSDGFLIIRPKFDTKVIVGQLDHDALKGLPASRSTVIEFLRSQLGEGSSLTPHQQEQLERVLQSYKNSDRDTVKAVHEGLGLSEPAVAGGAGNGSDRAASLFESADRTPSPSRAQADARWSEQLRQVKESGVVYAALERASFPPDRARQLEKELFSGDDRDLESARREIGAHLMQSSRDREAFRKAIGDRDTEGGGRLSSISVVVGALLPYVFREQE